MMRLSFLSMCLIHFMLYYSGKDFILQAFWILFVCNFPVKIITSFWSLLQSHLLSNRSEYTLFHISTPSYYSHFICISRFPSQCMHIKWVWIKLPLKNYALELIKNEHTIYRHTGIIKGTSQCDAAPRS